MGIIGIIARKKESFYRTKDAIANAKIELATARLERVQQANAREVRVAEAKSKLREAEQINVDLRAEQLKQVEGQKPSRLKALGQGLSKHMNKAKVQRPEKFKTTKPPMVGVPTSVQNQPVATQQGGIFGGQRNIDVGAETGSPFNQQNKPKRLF